MENEDKRMAIWFWIPVITIMVGAYWLASRPNDLPAPATIQITNDDNTVTVPINSEQICRDNHDGPELLSCLNKIGRPAEVPTDFDLFVKANQPTETVSEATEAVSDPKPVVEPTPEPEVTKGAPKVDTKTVWTSAGNHCVDQDGNKGPYHICHEPKPKPKSKPKVCAFDHIYMCADRTTSPTALAPFEAKRLIHGGGK